MIDQIAAGEVVERPASVVKELVENALDAEARRVRVEVRAGGRDWICVSDDGLGMAPEDARLALERHATSKLASAEDLQRIATYGFRGEALAAIASVSRLRLRSRPRGAAEAYEVRVEAGRVVEERATAGPEGTRIEVAELFAGVPARRKFLKTVATEWGHAADWLARCALALPDVHFDVRRDDRPALVWPAVRDPLDRIAAVISEEDAAAFVAVRGEEGAASLTGFVSRPDRHRPTLAGVYLFVNGRSVRDRVLQHALIDVYRDVLPRGRFPSAVLFVALPPDAVDVNVHPAKLEVRFADPRALHRLVRNAVADALGRRGWIAPGPVAPPEPGGRRIPAGAASAGPSDWIFARGPGPGGASPGPESAPEPTPATLPAAGPARPTRFAELKLLGQLLATYLALENKDGMLLIDQHAAHERVLYERLRAEWRERGVERQGLLAPVPFQLEPAALARLVEATAEVSALGFDLEPFGDDSLAVRAIPALLAGRDPVALVRELADELAGGGAGRLGARALDAADRVFASLACHSARRKGELLSPPEQRALLEAVDAIPWAPTCPHGRPVAVSIELAEIERRFGRR